MRSSRFLGFILLSLILLAPDPAWAGSGHDSDTREIGSRRELFVDHFLIDRLRGVRLQLHEPRPAEQVIRIDRPWENEFNYGYKVFQEGGLYHLIYLARTTLPKEQRFRRAISYARSRDGIHWEKPNLGLVEVDGSRENNVIMLGRLVPFVDNRPGVPANRRIKATSSHYRDRTDWKNEHPLDGRRYVDLFLYESSDGLDFRKVQEDPVFITTLPQRLRRRSIHLLVRSRGEVSSLLPIHDRQLRASKTLRGAEHLPGSPELDRSRSHGVHHGRHCAARTPLRAPDGSVFPGAPYLRGLPAAVHVWPLRAHQGAGRGRRHCL